MTDFKVIVSGAGPAGLAAAILLAQEGVNTAVISPGTKDDVRTTALMQPSMRLLRHIGVWPGGIAAKSAPLQRLRIVDDTDALVTAPTIEFAAQELDLSEFGFNVPLMHLIPALKARAEALGVTFITGASEHAEYAKDHIKVVATDHQRIEGHLLLIADGVQSRLRDQLGFRTEVARFDQLALATSFSHTASHENISTEWQKQDGPLTTVPLPGKRSSLVWMARPEQITSLVALPDSALATEIQLGTHGELGRISEIGVRHSFPMQMRRAVRLAGNRVMLIGEAAHALPPIGAQGLNLSLRDVATAADLIAGAKDPGAPEICNEYHRLRSNDVIPRLGITALLNQSLLSDLAPFHLARALGLSAVAKFPPLRKFAMQQGLANTGSLPFAMR